MGMPRRSRWLVLLALTLLALVAPPAAIAAPPSRDASGYRLVTGLEAPSGSTVGPGGDLYVAEGGARRIARVDPGTGAITTFAGPARLSPSLGSAGPVDVEFLGRTAYVLVTFVGTVLGGADVVGIYRVDGPDSFTVVANIGAWYEANPPETDI